METATAGAAALHGEHREMQALTISPHSSSGVSSKGVMVWAMTAEAASRRMREESAAATAALLCGAAEADSAKGHQTAQHN